MATLADFTSGLQSGMDWRQRREIMREYQDELKYEREKRGRERAAEKRGTEAALKQAGLSYEEMAAKQQQALESSQLKPGLAAKFGEFFKKTTARALGRDYTPPSVAYQSFYTPEQYAGLPGMPRAADTSGGGALGPQVSALGPRDPNFQPRTFGAASAMPDYLQQPQTQINVPGVTGQLPEEGYYLGRADGGYAIPRANGGAVRHMVKKYANGGYAIPSANTRSTATQALPMADGGRYTSALHRVPMAMSNGGEIGVERIDEENRRREAERKRRADKLRAERAAARGGTATGTATEAATRRSAITGREVPAKTKPRLTQRVATAAKSAGFRGAVASTGVGAVAAPAAYKGAEYIIKPTMALATGQDVTDPYLGLTETEEYRKLLGMDPVGSENELVRLGGDIVARGLGTLREVGDAILMGYGDDISDWVVRKIEGIEDTPAAPAPTPSAQPSDTAPPDTQTPDRQEEAALTRELQQSAAGGGPEIVDVSSDAMNVQYVDMPTHTVDEWRQELAHAQSVARQLAIVRGDDPDTAAVNAVKAVQANQVAGFTGYLEQARALIIANDLQGAARAAHMAWQYFPNGSNVKFGIQRGKDGQGFIVGTGIDEKTGEPIGEGKAIALNPESIDKMIENSHTPGAWANWTMDWRKLEQDIREYEESEKPLRQAQVEALQSGATLDQARALAEVYGGASAPTEANKLAAYQDFENAIETREELYDLDPKLKSQMVALMDGLYRQGVGGPGQIIQLVSTAVAMGKEPGSKFLSDRLQRQVRLPEATPD